MSSHELGFASLIVGILGIIFTAIVAVYVKKLDNNQRKRDQQKYEIATKRNARNLIDKIVQVVTISSGENDIPNNLEIEQRTYELNQFVRKNKNILEKTIQDAEFSLAMWLDGKDDEKKEVENIISLTKWILEKYLPSEEESPETQQRKWASKFTELENRKNIVLESCNF